MIFAAVTERTIRKHFHGVVDSVGAFTSPGDCRS